MARTDLTPVNLPGGSAGVGFQAFTLTAADAGNGNAFASTGKEVLVAYNSGATPRLVTLYKTNGTIEKTVGAGEYYCTGQIPTTGWKQSDSKVWVTAAHAEVLLAALVLP